VLCNAEIKFKAFLDHAMRLGADAIATGHYARTRVVPGDARTRVVPGDARTRVVPDDARTCTLPSGDVQLLRGLDANKDQSYFLHRLTQAQLRNVIFPVGELPKREVRRIAAEAALPNAAKRDSTGICFIGERPFREFLSRYLNHQPGDIVDERGRRLGAHVGLAFYTLGQRQGLGVGGVKGRADAQGHHGAWYVAAKDIARNRLVVVQGHDHQWLQAAALDAIDASWIAGAPPVERVDRMDRMDRIDPMFGVKTRYRQADGPGALRVMTAASFTLDFGAHPQWAATPGQSAVLYDGEVCLGGGVIDVVRTIAAPDAASVAAEAALR
jgi:tRNA-uridine 2-sulfurtransferase